MDFNQAVAYTHSLLRFGMRPGLERMRELMDRLGNPQDRIRTVHLAGTNGKGSTGTMISNILTGAGYHTGLFTSPYVCDFMERIQLDGQPGPRDLFAGVMTRLRAIAQEMADPPTEFEIITAAAFELFRESGCDIAVMETGLGGRLDSTNIVASPEVCVLTSISMDHMNVLGDTLEQIAAEKCGILKPGVPVVVSGGQDPRAMGVIRRAAEERGCPLLLPSEAPQILQTGLFGSTFRFKGEEYRVTMPGLHQADNAVSAILAVQELRRSGFPVAPGPLRSGLERTVLPARIQVIRRSPLVLLDGAHNEDGVRRLVQTLRAAFPEGDLLFVSGMMADKAYDCAMEQIAGLAREMITTTPGNPRALEAERLAECARCHGIPARAVEDPVAACREGLRRAQQAHRPLVVCGSLYLAGDVYPFLSAQEPPG